MSANQTQDDRHYTKEHEWAKEEDSEITVGITSFAVEQLGDITLVGLDVGVGDEVQAGTAFGTIESVKTLTDLYAPISGKVTRINEALEDQPELVNDDPWDKGWMLAIEPSNLEGERAALLDAEAYRRHLEDSEH